jgi:hypothetical protein
LEIIFDDGELSLASDNYSMMNEQLKQLLGSSYIYAVFFSILSMTILVGMLLKSSNWL